MSANVIDLAAYRIRAETQRVEPVTVPLTSEEKEALRLASRAYNGAMRAGQRSVPDALRIHNEAIVYLTQLSRAHPLRMIAGHIRDLTGRRNRLANNPRRFESVLPDFGSAS